jgi:hypothetical protein
MRSQEDGGDEKDNSNAQKQLKDTSSDDDEEKKSGLNVERLNPLDSLLFRGFLSLCKSLSNTLTIVLGFFEHFPVI